MRDQLFEAWGKMLEKLESWLDIIILYLPNLILAFIVFIFSTIFSRYVHKLTFRLLNKSSLQDSVKNLIAKLVSIGIILLGLFLALGILNLNQTLTTILAGAGVAGLAVGLALQGTLSNTFSGIILSFIKNIRIGDWVTSNGHSGEIVDINLRTTTLKEIDNNLVSIPNKLVMESPIKNHSITPQSRVILTCGVAYNSDLQFVEDLVVKTIQDEFHEENKINILFFFTEFGDSSINFESRFWIDSKSGLEVLLARGKAIKAVKKAFDENDITIPFPIRTVDFSNDLKLVKENETADNE